MFINIENNLLCYILVKREHFISARSETLLEPVRPVLGVEEVREVVVLAADRGFLPGIGYRDYQISVAIYQLIKGYSVV